MNQIAESVWNDSVSKPEEPKKLDANKKTDVLIVGGGMAGILLAHHLKEIGINSLVAEAKTIGGGATGNTTAKITAQHGLIYSEIIKRYGVEKARMYYDANTIAINNFRTLASSFPCDFEAKNAYVYSTDNRLKLEYEAAAYRKIKIPAQITDKIPLPIKIKGALVMENQAQFNPLKLLYALAEGLEIYEHTLIKHIKDGKAVTSDGKIITAKYIVLATHYPLINIPGLYFMKLYQHRSYVIALENAPDIKGIYLDEKKNGLSFRNYQDLLFIGGGDHKTGEHKPNSGYQYLKRIAKEAFPNSIHRYHWAAQDTMSLDGIPYAGKFNARKRHLFVATGFNKWGMTGAMVSADIIKNLIAYGKSDYEALYSPRRPMYSKQLGINLKSAAVGLLSAGGPRCSHMGCKLIWNRSEKTWDCPCHGSRFSKGGHVIDNPSMKSLSKMPYKGTTSNIN
ncbi:MAG: FAD-dependent oxidoreductase [Lachnospiraceae bacterium]|nr:FAD-dependent oxidoreductase [Lachnospiraceae bacterium]